MTRTEHDYAPLSLSFSRLSFPLVVQSRCWIERPEAAARTSRLPAAIDTMRLGGKTKSGTVHTRRSIRYAGHARRLVLPCTIIITISHRYGFTAYERRGQEDLSFSLSLCVSLSLAHPPVGHSKGGERKERESHHAPRPA